MDSPKVKITRDSVAAVIALLQDEDDEKLKFDTLEGETDLFEFVGLLVDGIENDTGQIEQLKKQQAERQTRIERAQLRIQQRKNLIVSLMQSAEVTKIPLPQATIWTSQRKPTWKVVDINQLPEEFVNIETIEKRTLKREELTAAFITKQLPHGATVDNGQTTLTIRRN